MAEEEKMIPIGETHETPQAITITIMDPSALGTPNIASSIVTSVEPQKTTGSSTSGNCNLLMVSSSGEQEPKSSILQTVTETHMGTEELPIISSISNPDHDESAELETKISQTLEGMEGEMAQEGPNEPVGQHCLICNIDIEPNEVEEDEEEQQQVPVFKSLTTSTNRRISIFLGGLVGQKLTSRKAHSDIMCRRCFNLLDRVDSLEVEIKETKEEIVNKYQETLTVHGGRARRKKPSTARKSEYVFPKVEPEDEDDQMLGLETDGTFEPRLEDLIEEEHDRREDVNPDDDEWEPEFKRTRIKREIDMDSGVPPKRKRGRPRKDATRPKTCVQNSVEGGLKEREHLGRPPIKVKLVPHTSQGKKQGTVTNLVANVNELYLSELLSCSECGQIFDNEPLYKIHCSEAHVESTSVKCPHCPLIFDRRYDLDSHLINHTSNNHSCQECGVGFQTTALLIKHLKELHPNTANTCIRCSATFVNEEQLQFHFEQRHKRGKRKILSTDKPEVPTNSIVCEECGNVCKNMIAYQTHRYNEHIHLYPFECKVCLRRFTKPKLLESHLKTHVNGSVECSRCNVKFGTESHLVDHMYYVHGQKKVLMCDVCDRFFSSPASLKTHKEMEHRENVECPEICTICSEKYPSKSGLKRHMLTHIRSYHCKYCQRNLSTKASLDIHINMVHTREQSFICGFCNKEFFAKHLLQMHIKRVHSDRSDFQFKCQQCGKVYLQEWELTLHHKTHTNERNYKCEICGDAFYTLSRMRYHKATHKTTRDSECPICSQMFRRDVDTKNHLRRVHKVLHPGQFMDLCSRHGIDKARELSQVEVVTTSGQEEKIEERVEEILDEVDSEHITVYCMEGEQKPPVQVVIPDDIVLGDVSSVRHEDNQEIALVYEVDEGSLRHSPQIIDIIKVKDYGV